MSGASSRSRQEDEAAEPTQRADQRFEAVVAGETIQRTIAQLQALVDECHIQVRADGIRLPATDPAAVASVDVTLDASAFESYDASEGTIGIDLTRFGEIVGMADRDQFVDLAYDPDTRKLHVAIDELEYTLALIDPDSIRAPPDLSDPGFEFQASVRLDASDVSRCITAASMVSDHVALGIDDEAHEFSAEATGDTDDVDVTFPESHCIDLDPGDAHSLYSVDYLAEMDRAIPADAAVELRLGTDIPLGIGYEYAEGAGDVEYLLGPRIARN